MISRPLPLEPLLADSPQSLPQGLGAFELRRPYPLEELEEDTPPFESGDLGLHQVVRVQTQQCLGAKCLLVILLRLQRHHQEVALNIHKIDPFGKHDACSKFLDDFVLPYYDLSICVPPLFK